MDAGAPTAELPRQLAQRPPPTLQPVAPGREHDAERLWAVERAEQAGVGAEAEERQAQCEVQAQLHAEVQAQTHDCVEMQLAQMQSEAEGVEERLHLSPGAEGEQVPCTSRKHLDRLASLL